MARDSGKCLGTDLYPFLRLDDSRTRASGGHGPELVPIVRRIIYWHGGRALISKSNNLGGACFSLSWPRDQDKASLR